MGRRGKPLGAGDLRKLYLTRCLTTGQIANRFDCSDEHVRRQLILHGIKRRQCRFGAGAEHPDYIDGRSLGGYKRIGWNPWNKGKSKETDPKVRRIARKISLTFREKCLGWKTWDTRHDAVEGLRRVASSLRERERPKYKNILKRLGDGWTTEFFIESFVFKKPDGTWSGIIADIVHPASKRMIEVDGSEHVEKGHAASDRWRDRFLKRLGWTVRRIKAI